MARKIQDEKTAQRLSKMYDDERADRELRDDLERLCCEVAGLDDAGLDVFAKQAIQNARKIRRRLGEAS